jgi:hypothetical protein
MRASRRYGHGQHGRGMLQTGDGSAWSGRRRRRGGRATRGTGTMPLLSSCRSTVQSTRMLTREQRRCATARALPLKERQRPVSPGGGVRRRGAKDNPPGETGLWGAAGSAPLDSTSPVGQQTQWLRKSATPGGPVGWCDGRRCGERLQAQRAAESAPTSHGADPVAASRGGAHAGTQCEAPLVGQPVDGSGGLAG